MGRRILALSLLALSLCILIATPILAFTPAGTRLLTNAGLVDTPTPIVIATPTPPPAPKLVLTVHGPLPKTSAKAIYLVDMDSGHVLINIDAETPLPMASTTKIMTALIAIQTGNLGQTITIQQDAVNESVLHNGSNAQLQAGEKIKLKDLLYALLLPSGDDAAVAIADGLGESEANFVTWMNLFAQRHHLYQTHYADPDGLNWRGSPNHYSTAADLTTLAEYAMQVPLFAQIVKTQTYSIPATAEHIAHTWYNTNNALLTAYPGMLGIKTGTTDAAGYCLVFAAIRHGHHLVGTILNSQSESLRVDDTEKVLNWAFALPMRPPVA